MRTLHQLCRAIHADAATAAVLRKFNMAPAIHCKASSARELAESLGFEVVQANMPAGVAGNLTRNPFSRNGFQITVNGNLSVTARRWAVLHEMGHYYRHVDHSDPFSEPEFLDRSGGYLYFDEGKEREANQFAEVILFGDNALEGARGLYNDNLAQLTRHFGVSEEVIRIALRNICGCSVHPGRTRD